MEPVLSWLASSLCLPNSTLYAVSCWRLTCLRRSLLSVPQIYPNNLTFLSLWNSLNLSICLVSPSLGRNYIFWKAQVRGTFPKGLKHSRGRSCPNYNWGREPTYLRNAKGFETMELVTKEVFVNLKGERSCNQASCAFAVSGPCSHHLIPPSSASKEAHPVYTEVSAWHHHHHLLKKNMLHRAYKGSQKSSNHALSMRLPKKNFPDQVSCDGVSILSWLKSLW